MSPFVSLLGGGFGLAVRGARDFLTFRFSERWKSGLQSAALTKSVPGLPSPFGFLSEIPWGTFQNPVGCGGGPGRCPGPWGVR